MEKILLINDSIFENMIMRDMLESLGYEVETTNEFDAYISLDSFRPSVIIANFIMKKITGDILLNKMKQENPTLKTILSSSNNLKAQDLEGKHIDCFIQIPVKKEILEKALTSIHRVDNNKEVYYMDIPKRESIRMELPTRPNLGKFTLKEDSPVKEARKFKFCPECGADLKELNINSKFCAYCGCKL